jgi:ATP-dependent RNA helicase DDX54/DBP10
MGFADQLKEIISRLPDTRQTLLFSATLPQQLVEFARAGLHNPQLIRLDTETKISDTLKVRLGGTCLISLVSFFHLSS